VQSLYCQLPDEMKCNHCYGDFTLPGEMCSEHIMYGHFCRHWEPFIEGIDMQLLAVCAHDSDSN
jgi:hypothetical protein